MSKGALLRALAIGLLFGATALARLPPIPRWEYLGEANVDGLRDRV
jgi:hypothetical protein